MENLITSYHQAEYHIDGFHEPIRVGRNHAAIDLLLNESGALTWCFITAWNPLSVIFSVEENAVRNEELKTELMKFLILEGEGRDPNREWPRERSFLVLGMTRRAAKTLAARFGQRAIVFGERGQPAELLETLFTLGNCEIMRETKIAFLCSRTVSDNTVLKCRDWAVKRREAGNCVISGFHSPIERDVFEHLRAGSQPIIVALARGIKKQAERELQKPVDDGRLLIISPFEEDVGRASKRTALIRNKLMIDLAHEVCVGYAEPGGSLEPILKGVKKKIVYL